MPRLFCIVALFLTACHVTAGEPTPRWPQLLGPQRDGIVRETGLNVDWQNKPPKTLWKVPLGPAFSSLTIVGDRVYTMAKRETRDAIVCLEADTGKEFWFVDAVPSYLDVQRQGAGPRATPTYQAGKLYCLFGMGELWCVNTDGKKLWQADIFKDTGAKNHHGATKYQWGVSMSPLVEGELVIVQPGGDKGNSVAAYHKDTGKVVWTTGNDPMGYASPIAVNITGTRQLIVPTGQSILGLEPVKGTVLWRYTFGNQFNATAASPVWTPTSPRREERSQGEGLKSSPLPGGRGQGEGVLFVSAAYGAGCAALEIVPPSATSKTWTVREKWKNKTKFQNLMATSMIVDGHIYGCHGDLSAFALRCLDLKSGAIKWEERVPGRYGFLALDRHIVCVHERGSVQLIEAKPDAYKVVGELPNLLAYKTWAAPAFANGKLFLRDERHVVCVDLRK